MPTRQDVALKSFLIPSFYHKSIYHLEGFSNQIKIEKINGEQFF